MLPKFTGVLAIKQPYYIDRKYLYRAYVEGRSLDGDWIERKDAESALAEELERLACLEEA
jgi:hypothetical protein